MTTTPERLRGRQRWHYRAYDGATRRERLLMEFAMFVTQTRAKLLSIQHHLSDEDCCVTGWIESARHNAAMARMCWAELQRMGSGVAA